MSKLDGYKKGDYVRVEVSGIVGATDDSRLSLYSDKKSVIMSLNSNEVVSNLVSITRIEPAFKVGDEVYRKDYPFTERFKVIAILDDGRLVLEYEAGDTTNVMARDPSCFTHA